MQCRVWRARGRVWPRCVAGGSVHARRGGGAQLWVWQGRVRLTRAQLRPLPGQSAGAQTPQPLRRWWPGQRAAARAGLGRHLLLASFDPCEACVSAVSGLRLQPWRGAPACGPWWEGDLLPGWANWDTGLLWQCAEHCCFAAFKQLLKSSSHKDIIISR